MLSTKQTVFVEEYLHCWNAAEAARRAGYSVKTVRSIGAENLTKPDILGGIQARLKQLAENADEVLARLSDHARGSLDPFINISADGSISFDSSSPNAQHHLYLIKKVKAKRRRRALGKGKDAEVWEYESVELHDSQAALIQLSKRYKLFSDRLEMAYGKTKSMSA